MKKIIGIVFAGILLLSLPRQHVLAYARFWPVQSIDTMKYSRDASRQPLSQDFITQQIENIAATGANYVAIDTPYDAEFLPRLHQWVTAARTYHLNVWFRGNWSGWEGWFDYPKDVTREDHLNKTSAFILQNPDLFQNGDIFTACPECENGGPGDPRNTGDVEGFRQFMLDEYTSTQHAFNQIGKQVNSNYDSMNGDVAALIMDSSTTNQLGGLVTIDHYVSTPEKLASAIPGFASKSDGNVALGEFGVPIPNLNGPMTDTQQATWILTALSMLAQEPQLVATNYWVNLGGSTALWHDDGIPSQAVAVITRFYTPKQITGTIVDDLGRRVPEVQITYLGRSYVGDANGNFQLPYFSNTTTITFMAPNHTPLVITNVQKLSQKQVILPIASLSVWDHIIFLFYKIKAFLF